MLTIYLSPTVLAVLVLNEACDYWEARIDSVQGKDHVVEVFQVIRTGSKLTREVAEVLFPSAMLVISDINTVRKEQGRPPICWKE